MKMIDLTNQRFGKLLVLERDYNYPHKGTYWKCKCDCGNYITVRKDQLTKTNPKTSCGCDLSEKNSKAHLKNEVGNKYGYLTVLKRVPDLRKGEARWLCQCDCGNTCEVSGLHLRNGTVQSCGCKKFESKNSIEEIPGTKYGHLTVMYKSNFKKNGKIYWHCKCDCGNECDVLGIYLRNGISSHCGCKKSAGEIKIMKILVDANISFKREYTFPDLIGDSGNRLRFDFGIFDDDDNLSYLIEYNGKQHYNQECFDQTNEQFTLLQKYDKMKKEYCKQKNIPLIILDYTQLTKITLKDLIYKEGD